jgi:predicted alpha/beta hydrolase family esterase
MYSIKQSDVAPRDADFDITFHHGMFCHSDIWDAWKCNFPWKSYAIEYPQCDYKRITFSDWFKSAEENMRLHLSPVHIGHSAGAAPAQILPSLPEFQGKIRAVIILNGVAPGWVGGFAPLRFTVEANLKLLRGRYFGAMTVGNEFDLLPGHDRFVSGKSKVDLDSASGALLGQVVWNRPTIPSLKGVCRSLVIASRNDQIQRWKVSEKMARYHDSDFVVVENSEHMGPFHPEQGQRIRRIAVDWLRQNSILA